MAEGCDDGVNGWSIGNEDYSDDDSDANNLYDVLENRIIPTYYNDKPKWRSLMRKSIKTGVEFTGYRMIKDYNEKFYSKNSKLTESI